MKTSIWNVLIAIALFSFTSAAYALPISVGYSKCSCECGNGNNVHSTVLIYAPNGDPTQCEKLNDVNCSSISGQDGSSLKKCGGYISSTPLVGAGAVVPKKPTTRSN
jgi:hypothetical protein